MNEHLAPVAVLGAGSWGTALAIQFARSGHPTSFWGRDRDALLAMAASRRNARYLTSAEFPASLVVEPDLGAQAGDLLRVAPDRTEAERDLVTDLPRHLA